MLRQEDWRQARAASWDTEWEQREARAHRRMLPRVQAQPGAYVPALLRFRRELAGWWAELAAAVGGPEEPTSAQRATIERHAQTWRRFAGGLVSEVIEHGRTTIAPEGIAWAVAMRRSISRARAASRREIGAAAEPEVRGRQRMVRAHVLGEELGTTARGGWLAVQDVPSWRLAAEVEREALIVARLLDERRAGADAAAWRRVTSTWMSTLRDTPQPGPDQAWSWLVDAMLREGFAHEATLDRAEYALRAWKVDLSDPPPFGRVAHREGWTVRRLARQLGYVLTASGNPDRTRAPEAATRTARELVRLAFELDPLDRPPEDVATLAGFVDRAISVLGAAGATWTAEHATATRALLVSEDPLSLRVLSREAAERVDDTAEHASWWTGAALATVLGVTLYAAATR